LAISHCITRLVNADTNENAAAGWVRATVCYQRQQGAWRVIHEHVSVPFDPMTGKATFTPDGNQSQNLDGRKFRQSFQLCRS
jgi:hypothetical protein